MIKKKNCTKKKIIFVISDDKQYPDKVFDNDGTQIEGFCVCCVRLCVCVCFFFYLLQIFFFVPIQKCKILCHLYNNSFLKNKKRRRSGTRR